MTSDRSRRRRTSSVTCGQLSDVVARLRRDSGLTQAEVARRAGIRSSSTISRLESGEMQHASVDLLRKLAGVLDDTGGELWAAVGAISDEAVTQLSPFWRAHARDNLYERTQPAVQRIHLAALAEELFEDAPGALVGGRIQVSGLAAALTPRHSVNTVVGAKLSVAINGTEITITRPRGARTADETDAQHAERDAVIARFLAFHAVAHALLNEPRCDWPKDHLGEAAADDLAARLILPQYLLSRAVARAVKDVSGDTTVNGWSSGTAILIGLVADRTDVPAWVAARRIAEDDLIREHFLEALR